MNTEIFCLLSDIEAIVGTNPYENMVGTSSRDNEFAQRTRLLLTAYRIIKNRLSEERYDQAAEAVSAAWSAAPEGEGVIGAEHIASGAARVALEEGLDPAKAVWKAINEGAAYHKNPMYILVEPKTLKDLKDKISTLEKQLNHARQSSFL